MERGSPESFGAHLKALRQAAGFTQEELAEIGGLSVHAISALERGERRRPRVETVRALSAALDLSAADRDVLVRLARAPEATAVDELSTSYLAVPPTPLVGRETELHTLRQWTAGPSRLITVVGAGGVGKTRLALELARSVAEEGALRVAYVPLEYIRDDGLVGCAIAEALGLADLSAADLPKRARAACEAYPTLLIVDNFEQVLGAAPVLAELLTAVPALRFLVTSRAPLHIRGERQFALGPLALDDDADALPPADLARVAAVRLLVERVRDVQPEFRLTPAIAPMVVGICRRLDALPLAIELAAPWMKVLSPAELLDQLKREPLPSRIAARDLPERQQTTNATVAWSYQLLDARTQHAFRRLGALPGRFSLDAAAAVLTTNLNPEPGDALDVVAVLIDRSLLLRADSVIPNRPLYRMLETVRAYAAGELAASHDVDAMDGLVRYCLRQAALSFDGLVGPAQAEWLHRVAEDLENYRAALTWLIARNRGAEAVDLAWSLIFFWLIRGQGSEGLWWYLAALNLPSLPPLHESRALTGAALMWFSRGELPRARAALQRAMTLAESIGDSAVEAEAADLAARVAAGLGDLAAAREYFARAIDGFDALGLPWGAGNALIGLSALAIETNDDQQAERCLDRATSTLRHSGQWFLARATFVRAILEVRRNAADPALVLVRQSLTLIRELQDKYAFAHAVVPLAAAAALKGDDLFAARALGARDAMIERTGARIVIKQLHEMSDQVVQAARQRLGAERWAAACAAGRQASIDSLLKDIDTALASHP
jgi:predicted ATPase/DNA-binding XRE family transcriptional regulator